MHVHLQRVSVRELQNPCEGEESSVVRKRVLPLHELQLNRQASLNASLSGSSLEEWCGLNRGCEQFLELATERLQLSARAYHRILRLARTIADMDNSSQIAQHHLSEAIGFRKLDRGR